VESQVKPTTKMQGNNTYTKH